MRLARRILVLSTIVFSLAAAHAVAQRQQPSPAPRVLTEAPAPVFQRRSPQARLQTLRGLDGGQGVDQSQLLEPFALTPQFPYVPARGALHGSRVTTLPLNNGPTGQYRLIELTSSISLVVLSNATQRYLIDCAVTPGATVRATGLNWEAQSTAPEGAGQTGPQIVSFFTPPLPPNPNITLRDAAPNIIETPSYFEKFSGKLIPASQSYHGWRLSGCEITPVAMQ